MTTQKKDDSRFAIGDTPSVHIPVLLHESIDALGVRPNGIYVDATAGQGGHSLEILKHSYPDGIVYGIEWDETAIAFLQKRFAKEIKEKRYVLRQGNFADIQSSIGGAAGKRVAGILFDFGFSRFTIEESKKGFSFLKDEPLSMAYDIRTKPDAKDLLRDSEEEDLASVLWKYGEERFSRRIAHSIAETRVRKAIETTKELADIVWNAYPGTLRHRRIHPATKTFQALRIAVNHELENIEHVMPAAIRMLAPNGRLVTVTYHSLEDRIVKHAMRKAEQDREGVRVLKKPLVPEKEEMAINPSSRSAKMRVFEKQKTIN